MILDGATPQKKPLTESAIQVDLQSRNFLGDMRDQQIDRGKIVIARMNGTVLLAVGPGNDYHSRIIDRASKEVFKCTVITDPNPDRAKPLPGVDIQGSKFSISWQDGSVALFDRSQSFGPFRDGVFDEPTIEVVSRFMTGLIAELRNGNGRESADLGKETLPPRE